MAWSAKARAAALASRRRKKALNARDAKALKWSRYTPAGASLHAGVVLGTKIHALKSKRNAKRAKRRAGLDPDVVHGLRYYDAHFYAKAIKNARDGV